MRSSTQHNHFSGWSTLAGAMLAYGGICGDVTYAYGVFLPSLTDTFQWSRSVLSGPYTLFLLIGGLLGPLAGFTIARFGARLNILVGNIFATLGLLGMSQVTDIWHVYFFFGVFGGFGLAFSEFLPVTTIINHWFIRRRSLAFGLLFASGGIAGFLLPPLISWFISDLGWRGTWMCLAAIHLLLGVLLAGLLIKNHPEEEGQVPDGETGTYWLDKFGNADANPVYSTASDWSLMDALKTPALWILLFIFSVNFFVCNLLTTHQVAYLQGLTYSPMVSATALGIMLGMSILGRLLSGILGMRFDGRYLAAAFLTCMVLGILSLMNARGITFVYLYSIFTGIGFGGMVVLLPNLTGAYFGRTHYSSIVGWTMPVITIASAASPTLAGFLYDVTGHYFLPFAMAAGLLLICIILSLLAHPPAHPMSHEPGTDHPDLTDRI